MGRTYWSASSMGRRDTIFDPWKERHVRLLDRKETRLGASPVFEGTLVGWFQREAKRKAALLGVPGNGYSCDSSGREVDTLFEGEKPKETWDALRPA